MDFNFDSLESVNRANPIKNRKQTWRFKRTLRPSGPVFTFSQSLFDELNLTVNSLDIMFDSGAAYLVVCNNNDGKWARSSKKGEKGKTFKNEELAKLLDERGLTETHLDALSIGINPANSRAYYRIIVFVDDSVEVASASPSADAMEMGTNASNSGTMDEIREQSPEESRSEPERTADAGPEPVSDEF